MDALRRSGKRLAAAITGGSLGAFLAVHAVHVAVAGAPAAYGFICHIGG